MSGAIQITGCHPERRRAAFARGVEEPAPSAVEGTAISGSKISRTPPPALSHARVTRLTASPWFRIGIQAEAGASTYAT